MTVLIGFRFKLKTLPSQYKAETPKRFAAITTRKEDARAEAKTVREKTQRVKWGGKLMNSVRQAGVRSSTDLNATSGRAEPARAEVTMRGFVLVVAAVFLMACGSGSPSDPTATSASSAATVGTNGDGFVPIEIPLTPGMVVELDGTIANNARLDAICATIAMDASLTQYRPGGTGCPQVPNVAATAEASSE